MSTMKGHPTSNRDLSEVAGETGTGLITNHATIQDIGSNRSGLDVLQKGVFVVGNDTAEAASTTRSIVATGHSARVGDQIRFTVGTNIHQEIAVIKVPDANTIILAANLLAVPNAGVDTFSILRHITPTFDSAGSINASVVAGDLTFQYNSVSTDVEEVTATPANSRPLPVKIMDSDGDIMAIDAGVASVTDAAAVGFLTTIDEDTNSINDKLPLTIGQKANAASLAVTLSTDQDAKVDLMVADLGTIDGKLPAIGSQASTASLSVTIASDEGNIPVSNAMQLPASLGQKAKSASLPVTLASDEDALNVLQAGKSFVESVRHDYSGGTVTTIAFTQLIALTASEANSIEIFDSSGETMVLGIADTNDLLIFPGGNGRIEYNIPASTKVSVKAISASASVGEICINLYS